MCGLKRYMYVHTIWPSQFISVNPVLCQELDRRVMRLVKTASALNPKLDVESGQGFCLTDLRVTSLSQCRRFLEMYLTKRGGNEYFMLCWCTLPTKPVCCLNADFYVIFQLCVEWGRQSVCDRVSFDGFLPACFSNPTSFLDVSLGLRVSCFLKCLSTGALGFLTCQV